MTTHSDPDDVKPVADAATDYNILDKAYIQNPLPTWDDLRQRCPIAHTERWGGSWLPTRYEDVQALAKKVPILSSLSNLVFDLPADLNSTLLTGPIAAAPISADPPEQTRTRQALLPHFTRAAAETQRPFTEKTCEDLIDSFIEDGRCDAASQYARQLTPQVLIHLLGVDRDSTSELTHWVSNLLDAGLEGTEWTKYWHLIRNFFSMEVQDRRSNPRDDFISALSEAKFGEELFPEEMVVGMCALQLVAGIDTTWSVIGSAIWHFATHQHDRQKLVADPTLLNAAVEEMLRFYSPVTAGRNALEELTYAGVTFQPGDKVLLNFGAANHDPEVFEDANTFRLDREDNRHIAFGVGIHRCNGLHLARMEIQVALQTWFHRIPNFTIEQPETVVWEGGATRGPRNVPVLFN